MPEGGTLIARLPEAVRTRGDATALEAALTVLLEACESAWPTLDLDRAAFVGHVGLCISEDPDPVAAIRQLHGSDLYLALASALGNPRALAVLEERYLSQVGAYVAQIDRSTNFADEVKGILREKLLVGKRLEGSKPSEGPTEATFARPKIFDYTGRGPLGAWLRVSAVRTALNTRRGVKREVTSDNPGGRELRAPGLDLELDYLKTRYKNEFREAFVQTLAALPPDERTVLRMHYLDGLTLEQVAVAYRVHRATAARWIAHSRERIVDETKKRMQERLQANPAEVESLLAVVRSQLDMSLHDYLKSRGD